MKTLLTILTFVLILPCADGYGQAADAVNPLIGTATAGFGKGLEGGGTMPSVNVPFAMTNFVAQTGENKMGRMCYQYEDTSMIGFLATHQPTVWMGDYGYVSVMPQVGALHTLPEERALRYSHSDEISKAYYYSVKLQTAGGSKIRSEIAGAGTCGIFRFTFPAAAAAHIIIQGINLNPALSDWANDYRQRLEQLRGYVIVDTLRNEIRGYNPDRQSAQLGPALQNFKGYFIIRFDHQIRQYGTWDNSSVNPGSSTQKGTRMGAYISFKTRDAEQVKVVVATSFISIEQARANLQKEIPGWDFEKVVQCTRSKWEAALQRISIAGVSLAHRTIFYTALYHTLLFPRLFSEYGRYYSAFDDRVHRGTSYNDYSLWDTFRALHPLLILSQPQRINGMVQSLVQMSKEGGWMPMWPNPTYTNIMIGTHGDAVVADAYMKGFRGFDVKAAYAALHKDAFIAPDGDEFKRWGDRDPWTSFEARGGLSYDRKVGYVPSDKVKESVARTIEYAIDDYCVAQMAKGLGKRADYLKTSLWSRNYRNVYHQETGFMAARLWNGQWSSNAEEGFTEGTKWTYTFGAMHDIPGMISMMGGRKAFAEKLLRNFDEGHFRADNEPGHHYPYLFNYCGMPWKTQELVREQTAEVNFRNAPVGINGNDDCGQTSAWYIFNSIGFYPVAPASGVYSLGGPQIPRITLRLAGGKKLVIKAEGLSAQNKYVEEIRFNGRVISDYQIAHAQLMKGGTLVFRMRPTPRQ